MPTLDIQMLLQPLDPDPCGPNLEYDADFVALDTASRGKPEQEYGKTKIPAEPPDWKAVRSLGLGLVKRTKDLRVVCHLSRGMLETDGVTSFCELLELIRGYLDNFWDSVHPQLDPDDDNDPTWRVNTVSALNNHSNVMGLKEAPYINGGPLGTYSYHDFEIARGEARAPRDSDPPTMADLEAAMRQEGLESLESKVKQLQTALEHLNAIEGKLTDLAGAAHTTGFDVLREALTRLHGELVTQLDRLDLGSGPAGQTAAAGGAAAAGGNPAEEPREASRPGEIRTRDDVITTLERLCQYYDRHEPSSPIPLLLRRAQRLATMSFLDIVKELTPDGLTQAKSVGGVPSETKKEGK